MEKKLLIKLTLSVVQQQQQRDPKRALSDDMLRDF